MSESKYLHEVAITAIVVRDGKYLITRRAKSKKRFPNMWVVPGGRLETSDYTSLPKDTEHYWYNVLEKTLRREILEEVGLEIENIEYITSLARVHEDGAPSLVISCIADYVGGDVLLQEGETEEARWITLEEAKQYDLIEGVYDELVMAENHRKGIKSEWKKV
ncbi:hypothetical protein COU17_01145 [Candidatus Kaiserbacteria bacterium CG10_big_fil_rev_8_21_14_0_10_49_17]|uniref:Nudix hydrolase domain-containing protein n=1 Tax=Candidatus Kaiserbacteria bacterium CG10_big_fil_rev_8_21_14_0_10_49_17 TaxID=1974609 RepID=A0A2M6WEU7_9BACT|nr:MAG: hypothetical protein COU17_01145 [Candidatus Kaiserbacteria bacterium CG10_big_fil_rev_8_21_14_0_10_49_17]